MGRAHRITGDPARDRSPEVMVQQLRWEMEERAVEALPASVNAQQEWRCARLHVAQPSIVDG